MILVWSFSMLYFNVSQFVKTKIEKIPCFTSDFKAMLAKFNGIDKWNNLIQLMSVYVTCSDLIAPFVLLLWLKGLKKTSRKFASHWTTNDNFNTSETYNDTFTSNGESKIHLFVSFSWIKLVQVLINTARFLNNLHQVLSNQKLGKPIKVKKIFVS